MLKKALSDDGISLVEVVVALLVFSVIALGVGYSTITILKMTEDIRSRQVATNLAVTELDVVRSIPDPLDVHDYPLPGDLPHTVVVAGTTYTITRSTEWVDANGADVGCGSGTGVMQSKRVNVEVTWNGKLNTTQPVRTDTLISPDTRINDPSLGTIRVLALSAAGTGSTGVNVTITPTQGGAVLDQQPADTDVEGCSFALMVTPGTYNVAINRSNSVDTTQAATPSKSVVVTAGGSVASQFQYDYAGNFNLTYANNYAGPTPALPIGLHTSYLSTLSMYVDSGVKSQVQLHPVPSGYSGLAGKYVAPSQTGAGCVSVDPAAWDAATVNGVALQDGVRTAPVAATPQGTIAMSIPMGIVTVQHTATAYLHAISVVAPGAAMDPGCSEFPMTYSFGPVLINGSKVIALPYGTWTLYRSSTQNGAQTVISGSKVTVSAPSSVSGNIVTLDPRLP
jgi:Tfp pilus assembly protein PilV